MDLFRKLPTEYREKSFGKDVAFLNLFSWIFIIFLSIQAVFEARNPAVNRSFRGVRRETVNVN